MHFCKIIPIPTVGQLQEQKLRSIKSKVKKNNKIGIPIDGVVKIDYGVGEKCLADPRNHYSSAAYIYCNETANHTTAKFNQTGCQYNFNYYSKYGIKRTKTSAYNCLGCVNTVPDRPAPHNWVKSSLSDSCTVADGSNTYSLSKIFNNK